jgi:hypothetical protein
VAWFPARPATETQSDPGYEVTNWFGILSSRGTPPVIVTMLNGTLKKITQDAEFQSRMGDLTLFSLTLSRLLRDAGFRLRISRTGCKRRKSAPNCGLWFPSRCCSNGENATENEQPTEGP